MQSFRFIRRAALAALFAVALAPAVAVALPPALPDPGSWVPDNFVAAVVHRGTTTYAGGSFDWWGPFTGDAAAVSFNGEATAGFPKVTGGYVSAAVPDGSGGAFIGGPFTAVDGQPVVGLAHIDANGSLVSSFAPQVTGGWVDALALGANGQLYAGGRFTAVDGTSRDGLAAVNATTGALSPWAGCVYDDGGSSDPDGRSVFSLALDGSGTTLYVGGDFDATGVETRSGCSLQGNRDNLAALSTDASAATTAWNPDVDGTVRALAVSATTVYLGGDFSDVGNPGLQRQHLAAVSRTGTGTAPTTWNPGANGEIRALALGPAGTVYAGGTFSTIGTVPLPREGLAQLNAAGAATSGFNARLAPPPGYPHPTVAALAVAGTPQRLYVGGSFGSAAADGPSDLASLDLSSGAADPSFQPAPGGAVGAIAPTGGGLVIGGAFHSIGAQRHVGLVALDGDGHPLPGVSLSDDGAINRMVLSPNGSTIYALGQFSDRPSGIAAFNAATGQELPFAPTVGGQIETLTLSPDGQTLYLGGSFTQVDGQPRVHAAAVRTADGSLIPWAPDPDGIVDAIATDGTTVYLGGLFSHIGSAVDSRQNLAAVSAATGATTAWSPAPDGLVTALTLAPDGAHVYVGGDFATIGTAPQPRSHLAELTRDSGNPTPFKPDPSGRVLGITPTADGTAVYAHGLFTYAGLDDDAGFARLAAGDGADTGWTGGFTTGGVGTDTPLDADGDTVWLGSSLTVPGGHPYYAQYTSAPLLVAPPSLSSAPVAGTAVTCQPARWRNAPATVDVAWQLDGAPIAGATATAYTPPADAAGHALTCSETGRNSAGAATGTSGAQTVGASAVVQRPPGDGGTGGPEPGPGPGVSGGPGPSGDGPVSGGSDASALRPAPRLTVALARPARAKKGLRLTFRLSIAATVTVTTQRVGSGRVVKKRCRPPGRHPHGKRCTLLTAAGSARWSEQAGSSHPVLRKLEGRALKPGAYRFTFVATARGARRGRAVVKAVRVG